MAVPPSPSTPIVSRPMVPVPAANQSEHSPRHVLLVLQVDCGPELGVHVPLLVRPDPIRSDPIRTDLMQRSTFATHRASLAREGQGS